MCRLVQQLHVITVLNHKIIEHGFIDVAYVTEAYWQGRSSDQGKALGDSYLSYEQFHAKLEVIGIETILDDFLDFQS